MWMQAAGIGLSMLNSYMGNKQQKDDIEADNRAKLLKWEDNIAVTAEMISTLENRTDRAYDETVRDSINNKMEIAKAQHKAEGEATVRAAQMGGGGGVRGALSTFRPSARVAGDMETEANRNLQTELNNLTEHFNDTANQAIANLNNAKPALGATPSTGEMLISSLGSGLNYYNGLSEASKAEFNGLFSKSYTVEHIGTPEIVGESGGWGR